MFDNIQEITGVHEQIPHGWWAETTSQTAVVEIPATRTMVVFVWEDDTPDVEAWVFMPLGETRGTMIGDVELSMPRTGDWGVVAAWWKSLISR